MVFDGSVLGLFVVVLLLLAAIIGLMFIVFRRY